MQIVPSIRKRYFFTILASLLRAFLSFITGMLLARFLGPKNYGNMAFLLGTFIALRQVLDMGSAQAFFTFMSQRIRSIRFIRFYFVWLGLQFFFTVTVIGVFFPGQWIKLIWHGEEKVLVLLAFAASFLQNGVWTSVQQTLEAQRQTYKAQGIGTFIVVGHVIAVILLWYLGKIGVIAIFIAIIFEYLVAVAIAQKYFHYASEENLETDEVSNKAIFLKFLNYCKPLIYYSWISFAYSFVDTWLLQNYGGSVKQAYYAVSSQFSAVALLATTSITNIFYKEIAEAYQNKDIERMKIIYKKVSRSLFLIGATVSCFLIPWSKDLLKNILGESYVAGSTTLSIMFLYPIHQSMGQIGGSVFFATEKVEIQVKIGIIFMLLSIITSYFVLAPSKNVIPGLNLASEGLALKMLVIQFFQVNVLAFFIARIFKWKFDWVYQPVCILGCLIAGWVSHFLVNSFINESVALMYNLIISGFIYVFFIVLLISFLPFLTGFSRKQLMEEIGKILIDKKKSH
jgi:O-antigen/teichoic acid export membrane protein